MTRYPLRRVTRLADVCWQRWRLRDGSESTVALLPAEYAALAGPNAGPPTNPTGDARATFRVAWSEPRYDTTTGTLGPGDVAVWTDGRGWFNGPSDHIVIGLEAMDRRALFVPRADFAGAVETPDAASVADAKRDGVVIEAGVLILDEQRPV